MKRKASDLILIIAFLAGLSLLLYPGFSDYWNQFHQSRAIAGYAETVAAMDDGEYERLWDAAEDYNRRLAEIAAEYALPDELLEEYAQQLNVGGDGVMGYVEIPEIECSLPIYHGTDDAVLQSAVGHIEWSSLPVGGESSHCVISGHRGLPSAKLFTNLDKLVEGDLFFLQVLDETLSYEVDQIRIVEPQELSDLQIEAGKDYCTLVTCTPYGVNTHRLLVRGHRVDNEMLAQTVRVTSDAIQVEPVLVATALAVPVLLILMIWLIVHDSRKQHRSR